MTEQRPTSRGTGRRPRVVIADDCLDKLEALAEGAIHRNPDLADRLLGELGRARIVAAAKLPPNVVAIGRAVTYRDESTGQEKTVTPVFPEAADISRGRVSVLTPIGIALIGLAEGASLPWDTRDGKRRVLTVLRVAPQEATEGLEAG
ncbi:nucleoside diphosphate kinase regulator [Rhodovulum sulfidophilum]|uniref:nucleoside diphosphate kinase regulator n=1 Tax=Rhodovulum sulfidophilum TaxID=35806 RepID=UPI0009533E96|nr:nucleoside diphosphate kinase regulator [Rhodovulum sulfidophilum]MCE8439674.1 nucleoside diphosphate kinase regulator [Rhodovulum sulfidophilum]MCE8469991.1 nucleoside diphosphate kinase regulator [Rhodovulum sulfidophilum]OLS53497.1 nucleoside-diphosphate kinase [Rhodovulum sulfidophilum]